MILRRVAAVLGASLLMASACSSGGDGSRGGVTSSHNGDTTAGTTVAPVPTSSPPPPNAGAPTVDQLKKVSLRLDPLLEIKEPIWLGTRPSDGSLYVAERAGRIWPVVDGRLASAPLLDMSSLTRAEGERGLLGVAFHPTQPFLYVDYTDRNGDSHVDEYDLRAGSMLDVRRRREVLSQRQPFPNHNGGQVFFGPDGLLYVAFGDGGSGGDPNRNGLNLGTWLGKLLRIDPRPSGSAAYGVPPDNPFVGRAGARPEIYSYGLRNPWRSAFDPVTGDLWIADVGQNAIEEIDVQTKTQGAGRGANFGWSAFEGTAHFNGDQPTEGAIPPVFEYRHGANECSITGGVVYRGKAIAGLVGAYLFGDLCADDVRALGRDGGFDAVSLVAKAGQIVSFGEDAAGEVYVMDFNGRVLKIVPG